MTHGTFSAYTHGCHCDPCKAANHDHQHDGRRWYHTLTKEQRRFCQVCHTAVNVHPIRACWREV